MISPSDSPEIKELARSLGVIAEDPFRGTISACVAMVERWIEQSGGFGAAGLRNVEAFQRFVTSRLSLAIEEIHSESDFDRLTDFYARERGEYVFAGLRARFDDGDNEAFGALIRRCNLNHDSEERYVAVVDCRGDKYARRYFTRWHEIAHRMTTHSDSICDELEFEGEAIEVLMDAIASELGFFEPYLKPAVETVFGSENWLTFEMIEQIICNVFPEASFQSTLFACMRSSPMPMVYVELVGDPLVFTKILPNQAAQADGLLYCSRNRHPDWIQGVGSITPQVTPLALGAKPTAGSVFHRVAGRELLCQEIEHHSMDLLAMRGSDESGVRNGQTRLHEMLTHVEARRVPGKVIGLLQY
jgi:hypothetical protein